MKIAQIAPLVESVPPKGYGGTERVIYYLTEELVKRGHDVTLFASGDSKTSAKLCSVYPRSLREASDEVKNIYGPNSWTLMNLSEAYGRHKEFDIIHDHTGNPLTGYLGLPMAQLISTPVVATMHNAISKEDNSLMEKCKAAHIVTISEAQARLTVNLNYAGTVYNGLVMGTYPFSETHENYLLYVGRICPEKGTHYAIQVAETMNMPLIIAAKLDKDNEGYMRYFKEQVEPKLNDTTIKWIGEVDEVKRNELMSKATALIHPVAWPEPFGLTLIEAMACGCPVVAFHQGSIPEVINDGKTGFVVGSVEEMIEKLKTIASISRKSCREYSLKNFGAEKMAESYERVYKDIINKTPGRTPLKKLTKIIRRINHATKRN